MVSTSESCYEENLMRIAAIPGDGIGKEVLPEGIHVLQAAAERWGLSPRALSKWSGRAASTTAHHGKMMPDDWHEQLQSVSTPSILAPSAGRTPYRTTSRCGARC